MKLGNTQKKSKCCLRRERDERVNRKRQYSRLLQIEYKKVTPMLERWSTGNCARDSNLTIQISIMYINQIPFKKMRHTKFSGILKYKWIRWADLLLINKKKMNLLFSWFCCSSEPQNEIIGLCQRIKKSVKYEGGSLTLVSLTHSGPQLWVCL